MDRTQVSVNRRMDKQIVVYSYNGKITLPGKEIANALQQRKYVSKTLCWVKESRNKRPYAAWFHLYEIFIICKPIETKSRVVIT